MTLSSEKATYFEGRGTLVVLKFLIMYNVTNFASLDRGHDGRAQSLCVVKKQSF